MRSKMAVVGIVGASVTALCCFTPLLPWLLGSLGLGGLLGYVYRDDVLLPLLAVFLLIGGFGLWRTRKV